MGKIIAQISRLPEKDRQTVKALLLTLPLLLLFAPKICAQLLLTDVEKVIAQAATRAATISSNSVIAVTDREGYVLGVWSVNGTTPATDRKSVV